MIENELEIDQIMSLNPQVENVIILGDRINYEDDSSCKSDKGGCGCYGYKPCTCDTYRGCPKE